MFWQKFYVLCRQANLSPNAVAKDLSIASGSITAWKKGRIPGGSTLRRIADYFNVSVDYLLDGEELPVPSRVDADLSAKEAAMLAGMRALDDDQVDQLLQYMEFLISQRKKKDGE